MADFVCGRKTTLFPLLLITYLVLPMYGSPTTVRISPLFAKTFLAQLSFFNEGIFALQRCLIIVILAGTRNLVH